MTTTRLRAIDAALEAKRLGDPTPFMELVRQVHEFIEADRLEYSGTLPLYEPRMPDSFHNDAGWKDAAQPVPAHVVGPDAPAGEAGFGPIVVGDNWMPNGGHLTINCPSDDDEPVPVIVGMDFASSMDMAVVASFQFLNDEIKCEIAGLDDVIALVPTAPEKGAGLIRLVREDGETEFVSINPNIEEGGPFTDEDYAAVIAEEEGSEPEPEKPAGYSGRVLRVIERPGELEVMHDESLEDHLERRAAEESETPQERGKTDSFSYQKPKWGRWAGEDGDRLAELWRDPKVTSKAIQNEFGIKAGTLYSAAKRMGLGDRPASIRGGRWAKTAAPGAKPKLSPGTQRRFTETPELCPDKVQGLRLDHPALVEGRTLFPKSVIDPAASSSVLISGQNSHKLGSRIDVGPWRGFPIFQLSLEERKTCPTSCHHWATCFGNGMPFAKRHKPGAALLAALRKELAALQETYPAGFAVRLHVLGDFYSPDYVEFWGDALGDYPALHVFGFTAWPRNSEIGKRVMSISSAAWDRFAIRFSDKDSKPQGATTIWYVPEKAVVPEGIVCPMQRGKTDCCATCGLCWWPAARQRPIAFVAHGRLGNGGNGLQKQIRQQEAVPRPETDAEEEKEEENKAGADHSNDELELNNNSITIDDEPLVEKAKDAPPVHLLDEPTTEIWPQEVGARDNPFTRPPPPKFRPSRLNGARDDMTLEEKAEKKAMEAAAVAEFLATKGARKFEIGASADPWSVILYLREKGLAAENAAGVGKYRVGKMRKDGTPGKMKTVGLQGLLDLADEYRQADGLAPLQKAVNGTEDAI